MLPINLHFSPKRCVGQTKFGCRPDLAGGPRRLSQSSPPGGWLTSLHTCFLLLIGHLQSLSLPPKTCSLPQATAPAHPLPSLDHVISRLSPPGSRSGDQRGLAIGAPYALRPELMCLRGRGLRAMGVHSLSFCWNKISAPSWNQGAEGRGSLGLPGNLTATRRKSAGKCSPNKGNQDRGRQTERWQVLGTSLNTMVQQA